MEVPSLQDVESLAAERPGPHVSIFLPVETAGPQTRQNAARLKNLVRAAEEQMVGLGMRGTEVRDFLEPVRALEDDAAFWDEREPSLGIYLAPGFLKTYWLPRLPDESVHVSGRFCLKPLVGLVAGQEAFYVLALSMNDLRFFRCTRFSERELALPDVPRNMAAALWPDQPEREQQFRNQPVGQASGKQGEFGVFHGSGDIADDETKDRILRYCQQVDRGLEHVLGRSRLPLVLAGVDYVQAIYRQASGYRYLLDQGIKGNPDGVRGEELREKAWQLLAESRDRARGEFLERFGASIGLGRAADRIDAIVEAALQGRVQAILFDPKALVWGTIVDGDAVVSAERRLGDVDLVDLAVVRTLLAGGDVIAAGDGDALPGGAPALAIFRY